MSILVGWWKGEDNAVDSVGGNVGRWYGYAGYATGEYVTGVINKAFNFPYDGSDPYTGKMIQSPRQGVNFDVMTSFSIRLYFKISNWDNERIIIHSGTYQNYNWSISIINQKIKIGYNGNSGETNFLTATITSLQLDVFYDLFVKYNRNTSTWGIYLDNILVHTQINAKFYYKGLYYIWIGGYQSGVDRFFFMGIIDEIKIYDDSIQPEYIMIKELECFLAKKQATYGAQGDDLTGDNYFPALPDSKVEIITAMTDIETVSATYDHDLAVRGFVNANAELSCYMRSLGDATEPDYALLARASGWAVAGPTGGKYTLTPIINPTTATGDDLEVWHYLGGIGENASVLTKVGNVVGNWKITGDVGKPVVFALTGAKGIFVSQAAATMVTSVVKDRTLIPAALPVTVSINSVVYKLMKFSFEGGNTVEQYIDCAETYGFGDSEITKKKIKFAFTCYANAALANPLDAVIAGAVVADVSIIWGKALYKTKIVVDDPQFIDCKTVDVGGLTGWEVTGNATQNDITITQNDDHV